MTDNVVELVTKPSSLEEQIMAKLNEIYAAEKRQKQLKYDREVLWKEELQLEKTILERSYELGDLLNKEKEQVAHGQWGKRLDLFGISQSSANVYMQLAKERGRIEANSQRGGGAVNSIRQANKVIAELKGADLRQDNYAKWAEKEAKKEAAKPANKAKADEKKTQKYEEAVAQAEAANPLPFSAEFLAALATANPDDLVEACRRAGWCRDKFKAHMACVALLLEKSINQPREWFGSGLIPEGYNITVQ